jgi:hypothetical protein
MVMLLYASKGHKFITRMVRDCTVRTLKPDCLGVEYLARDAQQQACQQEAEMREEQRDVAVEKHSGREYKGFSRGAQGEEMPRCDFASI